MLRGSLGVALIVALAGVAHAEGLHLECRGHGAPTVVLEAGASRASGDWAAVVPRVASLTRVCAYDRAGVGLSPPGPPSMSALDHARALEALLRARGEHGPFVLVGHSYGGVVVRVFAAEFPTEVAGLVLVDSSVEGFNERRSALLHEAPAPWPTRPIDWAASLEQVRRLKTLGDKPLVVLTAADSPPAGEPAAAARLWFDMQAALARLSTRGVQRVVPHTGHMVPLQAPGAVASAITEVVELAR